MIDLRGRVALVTGSSRGIGRAIALRLAAQGADVALVALNDPKGLRETAASIETAGRRALWYDVEVADQAEGVRVVGEVVKRLGGLGILVNNAGIPQPKGMLDLTAEEWRRTIAVNLDAAFYWSQAALRHMLSAEWGRIVMTSSMSGKNGGGGPPFSVSRSAYAASKAGLLGLTRGMALEVGPAVTVNAVCPGPIHTGATEAIMGGARGVEYARRIPAGRLGTPDDVAAAVAFLCSPEAAFITGEVMDVNGGFYID
jgi:3-oxoacyl-[acyl-carrier protein] reductase